MKKLIIIFFSISIFSCNSTKKAPLNNDSGMSIEYPKTRVDNVTDEYFGTKVSDPYRWLEDDRSEETSLWVKAENSVTENYFSKIPFKDKIEKRYEKLINYEKFSAPESHGEYYYYSKNSGLQNQSVLYREKKSGGDPEVFLDPNLFSKDGTTSLAGIGFSKDGTHAAYNISEGGSDWQKIIILNAISKTPIDDTLKDIKFSGVAWKGNDGFFYSSYKRPADGSLLSIVTDQHLLFYHKIGTKQSADQLIFGDKNKKRYVGGEVSENQKWLIISAADETYGNELYAMDLTNPSASIIVLAGNTKNQNNFIFADDNYFYIQTDQNAPNGRVIKVLINASQEEDREVLIPEQPEVVNVSEAGGYLFATYLKDAISVVKQFNLKGEFVREIKLPGIGTAVGFSAKSYENELFYGFTGYTTPFSIYKLNISSGESVVYKKPKVEFDPEQFESKQIFYTSKDGTKVPLIITYKKGLLLNGKNPTLLYGYGGFGQSLTPFFSTSSIILLENGGIFAVANLRGGGEYGNKWHEAGTKMQKQNVFDDFIYAAKYLKENNYTSDNYLALEGGSNGGLLVGAVITQQPQICKVAFPAVGVLDMLRYNKFTAGAGWSYDYGTAEDSKEMFNYLLAYSPLHNISDKSYPATLITTADHDDRVVPAHSFKFAATLQKHQQGNNPVLIKIQTQAGHGAGMSIKQIISQQTEKWSFMFYNMGITPKY